MSLRVALTHVYSWPEVRRGGERYLHELASALADSGHRVTILSTAPEPGKGRVLDVDIHYLRRRGRLLARRFGDLADEVSFAGQAFPRLLAKRLDVWHAFGTADAAAAAIAGKIVGLRSVYTDLGITERSWREARPDRRLYRIAVRHVDRYLALSDAAAAHIPRDYGRTPIVVGGGVDLRTFHPAAQRNQEPALLFPASAVEPRKNLPLLLQAVALLRRRHPTLELWLAGPGDPSPALADAPAEARQAAIPIGVASFEDLVSLYGRAWATVLPSWGEAFGLVVLESLACGTPAVTLSEGGPAELVRPDVGATGEATPESLAEACERALEMATKVDTVQVCREAAEPHDWRRGIVPRIEAVYRGDIVS